ncbi:MAG: hypothetical protein V3V99_09120 [candidate division Zixibacteria bacterium]
MLILLAILVMASFITAEVPQLINFQGFLAAANGEPVIDPVNVVFTIWTLPTPDADECWAQERIIDPDDNGGFNVILGILNPISDAEFDGPDRWLGIRVLPDPDELIPRTRLTSAPYAHRVATVDGAAGGIISSDVSIQGDLTVTGVSGKATIGPGHTNTGGFAFVAGNRNIVTGNWSTIAGGSHNTVEGDHSAIGGGRRNLVAGNGGSIAGGEWNTVTLDQGFVGGGSENTASGPASTVGGGAGNDAVGESSVISGGGGEFENGNTAEGDYSAIGGGRRNLVAGNGGSIAGGEGNTVILDHGFVGGGSENTASGPASTVGGGGHNIASNDSCTVAGGGWNTANGFASTVGGGGNNTASGTGSTVPGGENNTAAGSYSFAAGQNARAIHNGTFVWSDMDPLGFASTGDFQFLIQASGGVGIGTAITPEQLTVQGNILQTNADGDNLCLISPTQDGGGSIQTFDPATGRMICGIADGEAGGGAMATFGPNGNLNILLSDLRDNPDHGFISVGGADGFPRANMFVDDIGNGEISIINDLGEPLARLFVNGDGFGEIEAQVKGFRVANPDQPGTDIRYACPEGPEAAAYVRGTGHLENGIAKVTLPEHFGAVAVSEGITIQLTPLSAESRGLAVVEKSPDRFVVRELSNGEGTYDFDFIVMAVRKGHEDYQVIRPAMAYQPAVSKGQPGEAPLGSLEGAK